MRKDEIVTYGNELNKARFEGFSAADMDLFMTLCVLAKDKEINEVEVEFSMLKQMAKFRNASNAEFEIKLDELKKKIFNMTMEYEDEDNRKIAFVLFPTYIIDKKNSRLTIAVNQQFRHILNQLSANFTMFDLRIFAKINGKYGKTLYRMLAQYRQKHGSGWWQVSIEDFRKIFDVPEKYKSKMIMTKIINPALEELRPLFKTLICEPLYENKRGKPLKGFRFEFTKAAGMPKVEEAAPKALPEIGKKAKEKKEKTTNNNKKKNSFFNFEQRVYDYDQLELDLLKSQNNNPID